ncbi:transporter substrate-binding domain-containing protein [Affinibrenneria salicis]|nr:transporter substrate-binding domain-containing protein [Affinibrenneria salicis]
MKKKIIIALNVLLLSLSVYAAEEKTVFVGTQGENPGLSYIDENGKLTGFEVEVLREIDKRIPGVKFEYKAMDFASLFVSLSGRKVQIINSNIWRSPEREKQFLYTNEVFYQTPFKIVVPADNNAINDLRGLHGKKIAVLGTGVQAKILADNISKNALEVEVFPSKSNTEMVGLLNAQRVDALFLPEHQVSLFNKYREQHLKTVGQGYLPTNVRPGDPGAHLLLQKSDVALRDSLDKAIIEIKNDGTLEKLSNEWFGADFTQPLKL